MKKSIIAAGVGAFVVVTVMLCTNSNGKMYQKQKHFDTVNDVLTQMEDNKIVVFDEYGMGKETGEFKECLSKRKRLTDSQLNFNKIEIEKVEELDDKQKELIIDDYNKAQQRLSLPYKPTKIQPVRLQIKSTPPEQYIDNDNETSECTLDLVMVDEGEGMVIDYCVAQFNEDNDNGARRHVKG
ncbi:hypothetical protein [Clostridium saccharobutylicum]|uniref:Uncharacterized protein n=1 Tax=Clostridium saccharobutylicum DSM 13864 TaxID=1345695 RepID=U5MXK4_CLOSA|nr:hypothetical protein [Clostridium saccharobutylicum]AGX44351.1 hypothetical protein CLSA_c33880 [Clostridium saccharobutylicum DSM 13864]AQR91644.1 hypothetical protein CLOSC_33700 [Clostridium saccharobutylicum]AQS01549.1 hypothetical protein CSACC_33780 [Clostridium saccharobutylicum]AQS11156.1 hypothetical protein CLOBY_33100 [Clostridium saccharobutylicum]AQS15532.1 hypothetical protein CLOSACC_33780 [Clostridium saccharobutylicum]